MKITSVHVRAGGTFNLGNYENHRAEVSLSATLDDGDDEGAVTRELAALARERLGLVVGETAPPDSELASPERRAAHRAAEDAAEAERAAKAEAEHAAALARLRAQAAQLVADRARVRHRHSTGVGQVIGPDADPLRVCVRWDDPVEFAAERVERVTYLVVAGAPAADDDASADHPDDVAEASRNDDIQW